MRLKSLELNYLTCPGCEEVRHSHADKMAIVALGHCTECEKDHEKKLMNQLDFYDFGPEDRA